MLRPSTNFSYFFKDHKRTILALIFGLCFSVLTAYAVPPSSQYTAGETLDPACAPGDTNCSVESGGVTDGDKGDITVATSGTSWTIDNGTVALADLSTQGTATDEYCLTSETGGGALLAWQSCGGITDGDKGDITVSSSGTVWSLDNELIGSTSSTGTETWLGDATLGTASTDHTVFIGIDAGLNATSASSSNFIGYNAGYGATNANVSNFIGYLSGSEATNAYDSTFIGRQSGQNATNAANSIFIGLAAGANDTVNNTTDGSDFSILIGGSSSTGGFENSIAIGFDVTNTASNQFMIGSTARPINELVINGTSPYLNFGATGGTTGYGFRDNSGTMQFKNSAGSWNNLITIGSTSSANLGSTETWLGTSVANMGTASTANTVFIGIDAGKNATNAMLSNFIGINSGNGATDANTSNFMGYYSGYNATSASFSNFLGYRAGYGSSGGSVSNFIGDRAGDGATNATFSNFIGRQAGQNATSVDGSNFIGFGAGYGATSASIANFFGYGAGELALNSAYSNFIGNAAGSGATNASQSIFIGRSAGINDTVNNTSGTKSSILIGNYTNTGGYSDSIAIGHAVQNSAIQQLNIGNVLYGTGIYAGSTTPSSTPTAAGKIGIGDATPASMFTVGANDAFQVSSGGAIAAATGITSSGTITFSGLSTTGIVHNSSAGVLSTSLIALGDLLTQGTATDEYCLTSESGGGALLAWQSCVSDADYGDITVSSSGTSWTIDNGTVAIGDLLTQGTATDEYCLTSETGGGALLAWQSCGGGSLSGLTASSNTNTIDNANYTQEWQWNTLGSAGKGLKLSSSSTATTLVARVLDVAISGANAGVGAWTEGGHFENIKTGTSATNVGVRGISYNGTTNYGAYFTGENGTTSYGIYANAQGGTTNYGGYFRADSGTYAIGIFAHAQDGVTGSYSGVFAQNIVVGGLHTSTNASSAKIVVGDVGTGTGTIALRGNTSGRVIITAPDVISDYTFKLPVDAGTSGWFLSTDGSGNTSWTSSLVGSTSTVSTETWLGTGAGTSAGSSYTTYIGYDAGSGATSVTNSNFMGYQSGYGATDATYSVFIGDMAGKDAFYATQSIFIGSNAGLNAASQNSFYTIIPFQSIFIGGNSGENAYEATHSIFMGNYSGQNATNASYSNFIGESAGSAATNATYSNFIGGSAGANATNATYSNFIGEGAGANSPNASYSNFIGDGSGQSATDAAYSSFFGSSAGGGASNATKSVFIGFSTGVGATNASNSIFIGLGAGSNDTVNNTGNLEDYSILIGKSTSTGGFENSIAIGGSATNTASNQFMIGSATRPIDTTRWEGTGSTECTITTGTGIACTSDERLKTNIEDLEGDILSKLREVRTVRFNWLNTPDSKDQVGFIAQNLEPLFPELVDTYVNGYKSVYYAQMTPILVEAIKEMDLKIESVADLDNDNTLRSVLTEWFANTANGISKFFAKEIETQNLCVSDEEGNKTCITKSQLDAILNGNTNVITYPENSGEESSEEITETGEEIQVDSSIDTDPSPQEEVEEIDVTVPLQEEEIVEDQVQEPEVINTETAQGDA